MLRTDFPAAGIHVDDHKALHRRANQQIYASEYASIQAAVDVAVQRGAGVVWLPSGTTVVSQSIDLSAKVKDQQLRLQGQNTVLDARNLQDHAIKCTQSQRNLMLADFNILAPTGNYDGVHFEIDEMGAVTNSKLENIYVSGGGGYGFYLHNFYGNCWLNQLRAQKCRRGFYLNQGNAMAAGVLAARECTELAMELINVHGLDIQLLYLEANRAEILFVHGNCVASAIGTIYTEDNNRLGVADYLFRFGDAADPISGLSIGGIKLLQSNTNAPKTAYIRACRFICLELARVIEYGCLPGVPILLLDAGDNRCLTLRQWLTDLDIDLSNESADYPAVLENCYLTGTITRRAA